MQNMTRQRIAALDVLRGADLFMLCIFQPLFLTFVSVTSIPWLQKTVPWFTHVDWEGFAFWDLIMPLFMFMAGTSMPFSMSKYRYPGEYYGKVFKRVLLLFIFGMLVQGNLLSLNPTEVRLYSNTLQAIATGYLISAIVIRYTKWIGQIIAVILLLALYSGLMMWGGDYTPEGNFAEKIDQLVLGPFRDGVYRNDTGWHFSPDYRYTWILSSLNFGATVLTGVLAGEILKRNGDMITKVKHLLLAGALLIGLGMVTGYSIPVIKKIWSSSMVLLSSGICYVLLGVFYYLVDFKRMYAGFDWLKVFGANSIATYLLFMLVRYPLNNFFHQFIFGLEQYTGAFYGLLLNGVSCAVLWFLLYRMYQRRIFLKC